jgi:hypothetical protein
MMGIITNIIIRLAVLYRISFVPLLKNITYEVVENFDSTN